MSDTSTQIKEQISELLNSNSFDLSDLSVDSDIVKELWLLVNRQQNQVINEVLRQKQNSSKVF